jgi:hypothetical protein
LLAERAGGDAAVAYERPGVPRDSEAGADDGRKSRAWTWRGATRARRQIFHFAQDEPGGGDAVSAETANVAGLSPTKQATAGRACPAGRQKSYDGRSSHIIDELSVSEARATLIFLLGLLIPAKPFLTQPLSLCQEEVLDLIPRDRLNHLRIWLLIGNVEIDQRRQDAHAKGARSRILF